MEVGMGGLEEKEKERGRGEGGGSGPLESGVEMTMEFGGTGIQSLTVSVSGSEDTMSVSWRRCPVCMRYSPSRHSNEHPLLPGGAGGARE